MSKTETNRLRLYLYTSVEDYEEGDAARSVLVTGEMEMGREMLAFVNKYSPDDGVYLFEVIPDPRY